MGRLQQVQSAEGHALAVDPGGDLELLDHVALRGIARIDTLQTRHFAARHTDDLRAGSAGTEVHAAGRRAAGVAAGQCAADIEISVWICMKVQGLGPVEFDTGAAALNEVPTLPAPSG